MANLFVMPRRDIESKAEDNPVTAALRRALTLAQDVGMARVLVIYEPNNGQKLGAIDSGMTIAEAVHIAEVFKFWMLRASVALLQRRMVVFDFVVDFVHEMLRDGAENKTKQLYELQSKTPERRFLFGRKVNDYIDNLYKRGAELRNLQLEVEQQPDETDQERSKRQIELWEWFAHQLKAVEEVFLPYVDFKNP